MTTRDDHGAKLTHTIDMTDVLSLLASATRIAESLNGRPTAVDPATGARTNRHLASISADLLHLAALCRASGSEVDMIYWSFKGRPDPLMER